MGDSLTQYIKKKKRGKKEPNNNGDKPRRGARSEVGEQQARQPPPRIQALSLSTSSLTPNRKNIKEREGLLTPLPFGQWRGQVQSCGLLPTQLAAQEGAPTTAPHHRFSPKPLLQCPSLTSKALAMMKGGGVLQLLEEGLCPFSGNMTGLGAREYIHVARQGAGAFSVTPRLAPEMAAVGGSPSAGLSSEPT